MFVSTEQMGTRKREEERRKVTSQWGQGQVDVYRSKAQ